MGRLREWDYHLHNMILHGVHVPEECELYTDLLQPHAHRFRRFNFEFYGCRYDTICRREADTPYRYESSRLCYQRRPLELPFHKIQDAKDEWGSERNWWIKAIPTLPEMYDLRLNPINTCANLRYPSGMQQQSRGCVFCQRAYEAPRRSERRHVISVARMMEDIMYQHGYDVFSHVSKVMLVTGDVKSEQAMLELSEDIHTNWLIPNRFRGVFSAVSTLVRSDLGMKRLAALDSTIFEFPVECFSRRREVLGPSKGIDMSAVLEILLQARKYFRHTRINYLIGLDSLNDARDGFAQLARACVVDDIIPNIFVPPTKSALCYRVPESFHMDYIYGMRGVLEEFGYRPHRISATKDLYSHFTKANQADEFSPCLQRTEPLIVTE